MHAKLLTVITPISGMERWKNFSFAFLYYLVFKIFFIVVALGVHCDIYKSS
jgi:hypothetical protein